MRRTAGRLALATVLLTLAGAAMASTCYVVYDRSGNVVFRDTRPPVDMSDDGAAARERMRARGEFLMFMESDRCPAVQYVFGSAGSRNLTLDRAIGGLAPGEAIVPAANAPARSNAKARAAKPAESP